MSSLRKTLMKNKLPPICPRTSATSKLAPFGAARRRDYTPVSWRKYFDKFEDVEVDSGTFRVYMSKDPESHDTVRIVTLHGGGYSGLSWSLFTEEVTNMVHCQVISIDIRGHGETKVKEPNDMSCESLVSDIERVINKLYNNDVPPIVLMGHSMGGAVAVHVANQPSLECCVQGIAVIDVVEGTAMDALASMQSFLRSRPTHFKSVEHAIEWCVRSGQVRNVESAKVSMPSQIVNCATGLLATAEVESYKPSTELEPFQLVPTVDSIREEDEATETVQEFPKPNNGGGGDMKYKWRIDLAKTEPYWSGWFDGLSAAFLSVRAPRLLLLASIDGLDRTLTVGQMQGKFQMKVLTRCGHAVHEDNPAEVARVIAAFVLRHNLTTPTENGEHMNLCSSPFG